MKRRRWWIAVAVAFVAVVGLVAAIGLAAWWLNDNVGAPGPGATGSGPCGSADSVNVQLVFADGHAVQACTRDRPACPNITIPNVTTNGQTTMSEFDLRNQLRSSSRRYILFVRFDAGLPAEAADQTLKLDPQVTMRGMPGLAPASDTLTSATVEMTPRDPDSNGYTAASGTLVVSSSHGQARGRIDGTLSGLSGSPVGITGTFSCNR